MEVKVVIGSSYGDEGKGLVSYCLAKEAAEKNRKILTVFNNGTFQRAHTCGGRIHHCTAAGEDFGSDTYYDQRFVIDPIVLWLTETKAIINPLCRVILPCDVMINRAKEKSRGEERHGSCGMGLFEAVKRSCNEENAVYAQDFSFPYSLYKKVRRIMDSYPCELDGLYNLEIWMRAVDWVVANCQFSSFVSLLRSKSYDYIIFEGAQGLLLDQSYIKITKHLTPSSTGSRNIVNLVNSLNCPTDVYYVSRTYMTRHGAGPMEAECKKEDINPDIIDRTNQPNPWQGDLRFGFLNQDKLAARVKEDFAAYTNANAHLVFTQLNYTDNQIAAGTNVREAIKRPNFVTSVIGSDKEDNMFTLDL